VRRRAGEGWYTPGPMRRFSQKSFPSLLLAFAGTTLAPSRLHAGEPAASPATKPAAEPTTPPADAPTTQPADAPTTQPADAPTTQPATATPAPVRPEDVPIPWKRWPIFDPKLSPSTLGWSGGASFYRKFGENESHWGVALGRLQTIEERRGTWLLGITREWGIRVYSPWIIVPILNRYLYEGGLRLGPVELTAGVSLMPFTFDYEHGRFGFVGPSPGANARIGFRIGTLRISVRAEREYLWRWAGQKSQVFPPTWSSIGEAFRFWDWVAQPDALMTGFVLEISGDQPVSLTRGSHPLILDK